MTTSDKITIISIIITVISILIVFIQWAYHRKLKFFLFINKIMRNRREVFFDFTFTYKIRKDVEFFPELSLILKELYGKNVKKEQNLINNKIFRLNDSLLKVQVDNEVNSDAEFNEVFIEFPYVRTTLAHSKKIIENIEKIDEKIKEKKIIFFSQYSMKIKYDNIKDNPFIHTIVKQFGEENIKNFRCNVDINLFNKNQIGKTILITDSGVSMTYSSISEIRKLIPIILFIQGDD